MQHYGEAGKTGDIQERVNKTNDILLNFYSLYGLSPSLSLSSTHVRGILHVIRAVKVLVKYWCVSGAGRWAEVVHGV